MFNLSKIVNFFKKEKLKDLDWCIKNGLITYEEKLRLEADRSAKRLEKYVLKKQKKGVRK
jgi:hypothetical protein